MLRVTPCGRRLLDVASGGSGVWLVGGAVRDMVLGNAPRELDVAVEGDVGRSPGRSAARRSCTSASARRLSRPRLPLRPGPHAHRDLRGARRAARRDVGADRRRPRAARRHRQRDRRAARGRGGARLSRSPRRPAGRVLRVLHERSFVDDPTRVWRVARHAARLGFMVEPETAALAAAAGPGVERRAPGKQAAPRAAGGPRAASSGSRRSTRARFPRAPSRDPRRRRGAHAAPGGRPAAT